MDSGAMISNTQRMILLALTDRPLVSVHPSIATSIEALRIAGLIERRAAGYVLTARGRAELNWDCDKAGQT